jgi:hypothetical protein
MAKGKSKEVSEKNVQFAKGGKTHMFGQQHAGPQKPDVSGKSDKGDGGKFAKGGTTKMFGFRPSTPARGGQSAPD